MLEERNDQDIGERNIQEIYKSDKRHIIWEQYEIKECKMKMKVFGRKGSRRGEMGI